MTTKESVRLHLATKGESKGRCKHAYYPPEVLAAWEAAEFPPCFPNALPARRWKAVTIIMGCLGLVAYLLRRL